MGSWSLLLTGGAVLESLETRDPRALGAFGAVINQNTTLQETAHTGIYAQGTFDLTERLALTAGVRYSEDDKTFQTGRVSAWDYELVALASQLGLAPITVPPTLGCNPIPTGSCVSVPTVSGGEKFDSTTPRLALEYQWTDDVMTVSVGERGLQGGGHE